MNVKEYISSGIIESYVLGMATEAERQEFEAMCIAHPEIAEARNSFERALEAQLVNDTVVAPVQVKERILSALSQAPEETAAENQRKEAPVRAMPVWRLLAAASIILLAAAVYWAIDSNTRLKELQAANARLNEQLQRNTAELDSMRTDEQMLHKPDMKMAAMHATGNAPMYATIYWDTTSKDVYLLVNNMPQPASDKQYQLWALLDGKPIDLGVVAQQKRLLVRMKNVQNAQAFAITLEPKGGSPAPTSSPVVLTRL